MTQVERTANGAPERAIALDSPENWRDCWFCGMYADPICPKGLDDCVICVPRIAANDESQQRQHACCIGYAQQRERERAHPFGTLRRPTNEELIGKHIRMIFLPSPRGCPVHIGWLDAKPLVCERCGEHLLAGRM